MDMKTVKVHLQKEESKYHFRGRNSVGHTVDIDDWGGYDSGNGNAVSPMELLLIALGSCSGIDIADILSKGKQNLDTFEMDITGLKPAGTSPSIYKTIHIDFTLDGELQEKKVRRAIELSVGKYCSVAKSIDGTATISYDFTLNGDAYEGRTF
jgi:putative redox protein